MRINKRVKSKNIPFTLGDEDKNRGRKDEENESTLRRNPLKSR